MYKCSYPFCNHLTNNKKEIDFHHIIPKSMGGTNQKNNLIQLCPTHHRMIFVENCICGIHSIKTKNSIIIEQILNSTNGKALKYINCMDNKTYVYFYNTNQLYDW